MSESRAARAFVHCNRERSLRSLCSFYLNRDVPSRAGKSHLLLKENEKDSGLLGGFTDNAGNDEEERKCSDLERQFDLIDDEGLNGRVLVSLSPVRARGDAISIQRSSGSH